MNGYTLANHFRKLRISFSFSAIEADLFYELVALCNERNWPTEFQYPNHLLCATFGNLAESTLIRARNRLKQAGLLEFTSGHKRSPSVYRLLDPDTEIPLHGASKNASTSASTTASKSASRSASHYKEQTKRKTKTPSSAPADGVSEEKPESNSPPESLPAWQTWLLANAPEVLRLKTPLTTDQWTKLVDTFGEPLTQEVLLAMQNHVGLTKKYTSAYLTALDWCKRRQPTKPASPTTPTPAPYDPDALFGYAQSADAGLAQARNTPEYQQFLAEEAARLTEQPTETAALQAA